MHVNIDLEDGKEKVQFDIYGDDMDRFMKFMKEASDYKFELQVYKNALQAITELPSSRQDECCNIALNALDTY